jgi:hypothetical protein
MDIELCATTEIKSLISTLDLLKAFISENDREPLFDGHIYAYSDRSKNNEFYEGRIPVQVKGKEVDCVNLTETSYSIKTINIRAFLNEGGGVYFVVLISRDGMTRKIFYVDLLPFKAKKFLQKSGNKKTKKVLLKPFPTEKNKIEEWAFNFLLNQRKQKGFNNSQVIKHESDNKYVKEYSISFISQPFGTNPFEYFVSNEIYIYGKTAEGIEFPAECVDPSMHPMVVRRIDKDVSIDDTVYYRFYLVEHKTECQIMKIGKSSTMEFPSTLTTEPCQRTLRFHATGSLDERITDLTFINCLTAQHYLKIGENILNFSSIDDEITPAQKDNLTKMLEEYKRIKKILMAAGVNDWIDFENFDSEDFKLLLSLEPSLIYNQAVTCDADEYTKLRDFEVISFNSPHLRLLMTISRQEKNKYIIKNYFSEDVRQTLFSDEKENVVSQFYFLTAENYINVNNIDYLAIKNSVLEVPKSDVHWNQTNFMLLNVLMAYDKKPKNSANLIDLAKFLSRWLLDNCKDDDKHLAALNNLQIKQREKPLTKEEVAELHVIVETSNQDFIRCGAYVLLGDVISAKSHFEKLSENEQSAFKNSPIYNLFLKL